MTEQVLPPGSPDGATRAMFDAAVDTPEGITKPAFLKAFMKVGGAHLVGPRLTHVMQEYLPRLRERSWSDPTSLSATVPVTVGTA